MGEDKNRIDLYNDEKLQLSLTHLLQTIGEAARNVPYELQLNYPGIKWKEVIGMRNKIVHDYIHVDIDVIWSTIQHDLPGFIEQRSIILDNR
ncbi:DUF86 domain-containing protein [bacterium]|nr:DUF86 domain-containing protein [bacterium]